MPPASPDVLHVVREIVAVQRVLQRRADDCDPFVVHRACPPVRGRQIIGFRISVVDVHVVNDRARNDDHDADTDRGEERWSPLRRAPAHYDHCGTG